MSNFFYPFSGNIVHGIIRRRYKRFLADIVLDDGREVVAHVPNSGSMTSCWFDGARVSLTAHPEDGSRKLLYTLQAIEMPDGWVGVNTMNPNRAVAAALLAGEIKEFLGYSYLQTEVKTSQGSRFDLCVYDDAGAIVLRSGLLQLNVKRSVQLPEFRQTALPNRQPAVIEIKNATMRSEDGVIFPDAVTERGQKHLRHLMELHAAGFRAIMLFFAGRSNTSWVGPADDIDPDYGRTLRQAIKAGVEAMALKIEVSASGLTVVGTLPVIAG